MRTGTVILRLAAACAVAIGMASCTDGDDSSTASTTTTTAPANAPEPVAVDDLGTPDAGSARLVIGDDTDVVLAVTACSLTLDAEPEGEVPASLVDIQASGETADGTPLLLDVKRFRSAGAATTITDTITVLEGTDEAPVRALVAQRFEVGGQVTDGRDVEADDPLLRIAQGVVGAQGVFAPPGAFAGDDGLVEGAVAVACD